jgi:predicted N-acetyltransferase YhbS
MNTSDIKVNFLADVPEHGPVAMEWIYKTWGAASGKNLEDVKRKAQQYCNHSTLPIMFIATLKKHPVGCVTLIENDMCGWEHLSPWLASLYVVPNLRRMGIANKMESFLTDVASVLGYKSIYLFTPDVVGLYEKIGWKTLQKVKYRGKKVYIMSKELVWTES